MIFELIAGWLPRLAAHATAVVGTITSFEFPHGLCATQLALLILAGVACAICFYMTVIVVVKVMEIGHEMTKCLIGLLLCALAAVYLISCLDDEDVTVARDYLVSAQGMLRTFVSASGIRKPPPPR
jgi:hypothetical protein